MKCSRVSLGLAARNARSAAVRWSPAPALRVGLLLCVIAYATPAGAQDVATAEELFNSGYKDMMAGRYATGCPRIAESQRLDPRPGTLFTLAFCESRWGRAATAVARFDEYLTVYETLSKAQKAKQGNRPRDAKAERDRIAPDVAELTLTMPVGAPAGAVIQRDNDVVADAMLGIALPMDPGDHLISTQVPGGPLWQQRITLGKGQKMALELVVKAVEPAVTDAPPPAPPPSASAEPLVAPSGSPSASASLVAPPRVAPPLMAPQPSPSVALPSPEPPPSLLPQRSTTSSSVLRVAAFVAGGTALAGLATGGILGGFAIREKKMVHEHCGASVGLDDPMACDKTGLDAAGQLRSLGMGSTVAFATAVGAAALGVGLYSTALQRSARTGSAPVRWIHVGVLSIEPRAAIAGAQGVFE